MCTLILLIALAYFGWRFRVPVTQFVSKYLVKKGPEE